MEKNFLNTEFMLLISFLLLEENKGKKFLLYFYSFHSSPTSKNLQIIRKITLFASLSLLIFKRVAHKNNDWPVIYESKKNAVLSISQKIFPLEQAELTFISLWKESDLIYRTEKCDLRIDAMKKLKKRVKKLNMRGENGVHYGSFKLQK